jgi:hypothetical protein
MEAYKKSKVMDMQVAIEKFLETTDKNIIFVYGENDPWTGAAAPDPKVDNVKKYIIPYGVHTDNFIQDCWYPGGEEIVKQIATDIVTILTKQ